MASSDRPPCPTLSELTLRDDDLGSGATCRVRLAVVAAAGDPPAPRRRYALKVIEKAKIVGKNQLTRLMREKELLGELEHPSIVHLHGTLQDDGHLYFLLELLSGGELLWHMRRAPRQRVPPSTARTCLGALLLPLRYMQEQGVLYRDLKPTNIMFSLSGRLKLVDFGHAKRVASDERSTSLCGTPHYHAPEAVRGDGHGLPAQLWAFGVLLVEMMAGVPPFWDGAGSRTLLPLEDQILQAEPDLETVPDEDARALAAALLRLSPEERETAFPRGYADVMEHGWLAALEWQSLTEGSCVPEFEFAAHAAQSSLGDDDEGVSL